jgi:hypothetical protein
MIFIAPFVSSPSTALQALRMNFGQMAEVETPNGSARTHGISTSLDANGEVTCGIS